MVAITPQKAYIFGIIIGSGRYQNGELSLDFPYKQWGSVKENPARAGEIATDLINYLNPIFNEYYGITLTYHTIGDHWKVVLHNDCSKLFKELKEVGIELNGAIRSQFPVSKIIGLLTDDYQKRSFVAGLADSIGSVAESHRRFTDEIQIISFELNTFRFDNAVHFCTLLHQLGCYPDQVLWNHPSMHSGKDRYYSQWKKGVKIRVTLDNYLTGRSFRFKSKSDSAKENLKVQEGVHKTTPCFQRDCSSKVTCIHKDIDSKVLPEPFRGHVFVHHKQICAAAGCPYAPYDALNQEMLNIYEMVSPFTLKTLGTKAEIEGYIASDPILSKIDYEEITIPFNKLMKMCDDNEMLFSRGRIGYKSHLVREGLHYLICAANGSVKGKRPMGIQSICFEEMYRVDPGHQYTIMKPNRYSVLIITDGNYSAMIGCVDPILNRKLIVKNPDNRYLIRLKQPNLEDLSLC